MQRALGLTRPHSSLLARPGRRARGVNTERGTRTRDARPREAQGVIGRSKRKRRVSPPSSFPSRPVLPSAALLSLIERRLGTSQALGCFNHSWQPFFVARQVARQRFLQLVSASMVTVPWVPEVLSRTFS